MIDWCRSYSFIHQHEEQECIIIVTKYILIKYVNNCTNKAWNNYGVDMTSQKKWQKCDMPPKTTNNK